MSSPCDTNSDDDVNSFCLVSSPTYIAFACVPLFSYLVLAASFRAHSCVTPVNRTRRRGMRSFLFLFFKSKLVMLYLCLIMTYLHLLQFLHIDYKCNSSILSWLFSRYTSFFYYPSSLSHTYTIQHYLSLSLFFPFSPLEK